MKTKILNIALFALMFTTGLFAQDVTTVRANSYDISDNLDLKAVASIFGDSRDLEDFERRLNDPNLQISNLDLNGDNRVDYLRVIEVTENNTHLIVLQSVLGIDTFQDVATIEVERDRYNNVQVQVVGDVYMYGPNYIYEPVYVTRPAIYSIFWVNTYRPYYSPWYWGYYPVYYNYWAPCPVYTYRRNVHSHIDYRNTYHYASSRNSTRAVAMYTSRRQNAYERQHPNRSFSKRTEMTNRHALEQSRTAVARNNTSPRSTASGSSRSTFTNSSRAATTGNAVRSTNVNTVRSADTNVSRSNSATRSNNSSSTVRSTTPSRSTAAPSRSNSSSVRSTTAPAQSGSNTVQPSMQSSPSRSNAVQRSSTPAVRSTPSTPAARSSAPVAPSRSSSGSGSTRSSGRNSRG